MLNIRINLKSKRDFMSKPGLDCKNLHGQVHQEVKININSSAHTQVSIKTGKNEGSKSDKVPINGKETDRTQRKKQDCRKTKPVEQS